MDAMSIPAAPPSDRPDGPVGWRRWVVGARPRTLPAAVVPVLVGTAVAMAQGHAVWWRGAVALAVSLALQVGVNYANDYSDGVRGTDDVRVGPTRLVASGMASPSAVKRAAFAAFGVACIGGFALAAVTSWWIIGVGICAVAAAWFYTGGPRPYGYAGLGEPFVFVFFGIVAVAGTAYVQLERVTRLALVSAVPVGLLAVALLVVNNLRDIPGDTASGKRTLAVRLGDQRTRVFYAVTVLAPFACVPAIAFTDGRRGWVFLALLAGVLSAIPLRSVRAGAGGRDLIPVLGATGKLQLAFGIALAVGLAI